jgi:hypothetical protein
MDFKEYAKVQRDLAKAGQLCPVWAELQILALQATMAETSMEDLDGRKHRRAVIMHTRTCNHKVCRAVSAMAKKIFGPDFSVEQFIQDGQAEMDRLSQEKLK